MDMKKETLPDSYGQPSEIGCWDEQPSPDWLFIGAFPGGDLYADKRIYEHGDYKKIALVNKYGIQWYPGGINTDASVRERIFKNAEKQKQEYIEKINRCDMIQDDRLKSNILGREYESLFVQLPSSIVVKTVLDMSELSLNDRVLKTYETLREIQAEQNDLYLAHMEQERQTVMKKRRKNTAR